MTTKEAEHLASLRQLYLDLVEQAAHDEEHGDEESYGETMKRICELEREIERIEDSF